MDLPRIRVFVHNDNLITLTDIFQARLKAIEELNKKREEKRKLQEKILQEELQATSETNKVKRKIIKRAVTPKKTVRKDSPAKKDVKEEEEPETNLQSTTTTTVDTTYDNLVDEIFLTNTRQVRSTADSDIDTPRVGWEPGTENLETPTGKEKETEGKSSVVGGSGSAKEEKKVFASLLETLKMLEIESDQALSEAKSSSIVIPPTPKLTQGEIYRYLLECKF